MRERVEALGGKLRVGPLPGAGWAVQASLPVPAHGQAVTVQVLLADDQALVRSGFRLILESQPGITVAAEAADGIQAVALARELRPDVCLVDIRMPGQDGIEVTRALAGPDVADPLRVVIVTTFDTDEYVYGALRAGAVGFLLKDAGPALLIEAVRAATPETPSISRQSPSASSGSSPQPATRPPEPGNQLSERELDIARSIARGRTNQEVAAELHLAQHSQDPHHPHSEQARRPQPSRNRRMVLGEPDHGPMTFTASPARADRPTATGRSRPAWVVPPGAPK